MTERILFVHAHPDDESISTGGAIATLVDRGIAVTVLTCTRGERGEVVPAELAHLEGSPELVPVRERERADALAVLGVTDARWLGESGARRSGLPARRYVDSGMRWGDEGPELPGDLDPESLCAADPDAVAADIAAAARDCRADVIVSYDRRGGYGHPDHVRTAAAARIAASLAGVEYLEVLPDAEPDRDADANPAANSGTGSDSAAGTGTVDVRPVLDRKRAALAAHRTQLSVQGDDFVLSNGVRHPIGVTERFRAASVYDEPFDEPPGPGWRVAGIVLVLAAGAALGAIGTIGHGYAPPWGLVLALAAVAGLVAGLRLITGTRALAFAASVGVLAAQALFALPSPGGSVLVPDDGLGLAWTLGPAIIVIVVLVWPRSLIRGRRSRAGAGILDVLGARAGSPERPR